MGEAGRLSEVANLQDWRRQREEGTLQALTPRKRGRKSNQDHQLRQVQARKGLEKAEIMLDIQKKVSHLAELMDKALRFSETHGIRVGSQALGLPPSSLYREKRRREQPAVEARPRPTSPRALSPPEREAVVEVLHSRQFIDKAPAAVWAELLDDGTCAHPNHYRILAGLEVRERRRQRRHPHFKAGTSGHRPKPMLVMGHHQAEGALGYYYLYVILDIFSRYVVGWMVATQESSRLAKVLIAQS